MMHGCYFPVRKAGSSKHGPVYTVGTTRSFLVEGDEYVPVEAPSYGVQW